MGAAVGQGTTEAFVKEQEQECDLNALGSELVGVMGAIVLQEPVTFPFS